MTGFVEPVVLTGEQWVRLEPLTAAHAPEIIEASASVRELWFTSAPTPETAQEWDRRAAGGAAPADGSDVRGARRRRHPGGVLELLQRRSGQPAPRDWLHLVRARRAATGVNTECKLLLLTHAFEQLGCVAVEFRTHFFNSTSRTAIERLGAKLDGVLRSHQVLPDGSRRDTVVYSILDVEWLAVRNNLRFRLGG